MLVFPTVLDLNIMITICTKMQVLSISAFSCLKPRTSVACKATSKNLASRQNCPAFTSTTWQHKAPSDILPAERFPVE